MPRSCMNGCFEAMKIKQCSKSNPSNPNSNVPLPCTVPGCPQQVWKYQWRAHLRRSHPQHATQTEHLHHASFALKTGEMDVVLKHKLQQCP